MTRVTLYSISGVSEFWNYEPFDHTKLPAQIVQGVTIESVMTMFNKETFSWVASEMGNRDLDTLSNVKYAIVHRFEVPSDDSGKAERESDHLVYRTAACLRLIRPMRQAALTMSGSLLPDGTVKIRTFDHPVHLMDVPRLQKGFSLRNRDITDLQKLINEFLRGMSGEFWKFRMSVAFHDGGHFAVSYWKSRFMLWCSAVEALFTSQNRDHQGSLVATERIKWFLGANTQIYARGDFPTFMPEASYTVAQIVDDLYEVRNCIAHGERIPQRFFAPIHGGYLGEDGNIVDVLHDGLSFIIRASLLRILKDNLLQHFADGPAAEKYFAAAGLTKAALLKAKTKRP
jgi:hypothetical protein